MTVALVDHSYKLSETKTRWRDSDKFTAKEKVTHIFQGKMPLTNWQTHLPHVLQLLPEQASKTGRRGMAILKSIKENRIVPLIADYTQWGYGAGLIPKFKRGVLVVWGLKCWIARSQYASSNSSRAITFTFLCESYETAYLSSYGLNSCSTVLGQLWD